jgi:hypothetical protein
MVYGCDPAWWKHRLGLPKYQGLKVTWAGSNLSDYPDIRTVRIPKAKGTGFADEMLFDEVGTIGAGGNSGFQAINLAVQLGAARILLIGFDMSDAAGVHWYGRNNWSQANNPDPDCFKRWTGSLLRAVPVLKARGVEVIDCSLQGALHCFPKVALEAVDLDRLGPARGGRLHGRP